MMEEAFCLPVVNVLGSCRRVPAGRLLRAGRVVHLVDSCQGERATDDQLGQRVRHLAVGLQVGLHVLLNGEGNIRVADALAERFPVDLRVLASRRVAVS